MDFNFDQTIDRSRSDSIKWHYFDPEILPMWVADMDFLSPPAVVRALVERVQHGIYGYGSEPAALREVIRERLERLYAWKVPAEAIVFLPGVISGFNLCCSAFTRPGDSLVIQTPVYPPILHAHRNHGLQSRQNSLVCGPDSRYDVDYDDFAAALREKPGMFLLCNPHNPVGKVFQRGELERLAELCLANDYLICSDEIHGDLIFSESKHIPIASLDGEIARRTITLMAPSKTFNIAGLDCSFAVIPDEDLRKQFEAGRKGMIGSVNVLGFTAAEAAYRGGQDWLDALLAYLQSNRDRLLERIETDLPGIRMGKPEGTYLAWLDCRALDLPQSACEFFIQTGRVAMNDGVSFGKEGAGFIRLNFGCPRSQLDEALDRMAAALKSISA